MARYVYIIDVHDGDPVSAVCSNLAPAMRDLREMAETESGSVFGSIASLRAAHCYGVAFVAMTGARGTAIRHCTNTTQSQRHIPVFTPPDLFDVRPFDVQVVVVDLVDGAVSLPDFRHPERAMYLFGPEDGTLERRHIERAQHVVSIPTRGCMNLGATVQVVLYDRAVKRSEWPAAQAS